MKILSGILMFILMGVIVDAQESKPAPEAKIVTEIASSSAVKNAPFSADAVSESVQTLADGNRIVRSSTSKLYRNSEGRFRREVTGGTGGMLGSFYTYGQGVTLLDPVGGFRYSIDPNLKTTRQWVYTPRPDIKVVTGTGEAAVAIARARDEAKAATVVDGSVRVGTMSDKLKEEIRAAVVAAPGVAAHAVTGQVIGGVMEGITTMGLMNGGQGNSKWDTRTEQLGTQNIEGVDAEGTRTVTTIPAGAIGNERPIEITYEKWYSRELQLVVMSKHSDPRFGEQTYRLTNIVRSEPDPSLFTPPQGYKVITEPSGKTYTINARNASYVEKTTPAKPATAVTKAKP